jgi:CRISPR-associated protein Cas1
VSFLSERGRFLARIEGATSGNVLLRREQYRRADDPAASARLAQAFVSAKVFNARIVLMRAARDHPDTQGRPEVEAAATRLGQVVDDLRQDRELDAIRGMEGDAARVYFSVFDHLITTQKEDFFFHERTRRPPMDSMNALLSFLYTILAHDCRSALESVGLDPQVGFLHRDRPGRPSLALDLLEEFRPLLADRVALSLVNLRQLQSKGFRIHEAGAVFMDDETRKTVLATYQKRKREEIEHPFLGEKIAAGLLPYLQARLLSRHLRGDLDAYPPFLWK